MKNFIIAHSDRAKIELDLNGLDRESIVHLMSVCRVEPNSDAWIDGLTGKTKIISLTFGARDVENGGGFEQVEVESGLIAPYLKLLKERTGFEPTGEIEIACLRELTYTHTCTRATIKDGKLMANGIANVHLNHGEQVDAEKRQEKAKANFLRYLEEDLGCVDPIPEFLQTGNGLYKPNPQWGRGYRSPIRASVKNETLWQELFGYWLENHGTPEQKAAIARLGRYQGMKELYPRESDYSGFHVDDYRQSISWGDFKANNIPPVLTKEEYDRKQAEAEAARAARSAAERNYDLGGAKNAGK